MAALLAAMAAVAIVAVTRGAYDIDLDRLLNVFSGAAFGPADVVIWKIRLPRLSPPSWQGEDFRCQVLPSSRCLKSAGCAFHPWVSVMEPPFGASAAIVFLDAQIFLVTAFAFAGAMCSTVVIMVLGQIQTPLAGSNHSRRRGPYLPRSCRVPVLVQYLASDTQLCHGGFLDFW